MNKKMNTTRSITDIVNDMIPSLKKFFVTTLISFYDFINSNMRFFGQINESISNEVERLRGPNEIDLNYVPPSIINDTTETYTGGQDNA